MTGATLARTPTPSPTPSPTMPTCETGMTPRHLGSLTPLTARSSSSGSPAVSNLTTPGPRA